MAAHARVFDLLALPDDLLLAVARHALAAELPSALRLVQALYCNVTVETGTRTHHPNEGV